MKVVIEIDCNATFGTNPELNAAYLLSGLVRSLVHGDKFDKLASRPLRDVNGDPVVTVSVVRDEARHDEPEPEEEPENATPSQWAVCGTATHPYGGTYQIWTRKDETGKSLYQLSKETDAPSPSQLSGYYDLDAMINLKGLRVGPLQGLDND